MTWGEYFKDSNLTKVPQEFFDKEIIVDDCLQMIGMMSFTIKELLDKTKWHTGTPTEEGWYLIAFLGANKRIEYASAVWCYNEWDAHCRILAWQKIEPYRESEE